MDKLFLSFVIRKIASCLFSLWLIITLTFFLMKAVPGDPLTQEQALNPQVYDNLRTYYGFDTPLFEQYLIYLRNILSFNLGASHIHTGRTAASVITEAFPVSAYLGLEALILAAGYGLIGGVLFATTSNSLCRFAIHTLGILLLSIPSFILGAFLQYFFGVQCEWLPIARWDSFEHTILPSMALAAMPGAFLAKLIGTSLKDVLKQDYILLAEAKGLPFQMVLRKHALRNALIPLFGYFGKMSANILVGSFVIEKIFCIPGLGYWFVSSIGSRDYPLIMALTTFYSILLLGALLVADIAHAWMDTRLYRKSKGALV